MSPVITVPKRRVSSLPILEFCGPAGELSQGQARREAAMSSAFHAVCAKSPNASELCMRLTADEMQTIMGWHKPINVDLGQGRILRYEDAEKEFALALTADGEYCDPDDPAAVVVGHPDMCWVIQIGSMKVAYVGDIKRSEFTVNDGPESLQLHGYAQSYASKHGCDAYAVGIWAAIEGRWTWGEIVDLLSPEALAYQRRVIAAATNHSTEYAMGPHCRSCYGRLKCPAWLLPPELAATKLAPVAQGGTITQDNAAELLLTYQAFIDTAKRVEENLKEYARRHGGIVDPKTGKVWRPVVCQGRESVSVARVREHFGDDADRVVVQGKPYEQYKWVKP